MFILGDDSMFEHGYVERQISAISKMVAALLTGKKAQEELEENREITFTGLDLKRIILEKYLNERKINEAENYVSELIDEDTSKENYELAIYMYRYINELPDTTLEKANYSREEIVDGLKDLEEIYKK